MALAAATAVARAATRPDTSAWTCALCPFSSGASATVEAGVRYADGANAASGRYTGVDRNGAYAKASANGRWRSQDGHYGSFDLSHLGLASRGARVSAGLAGRYEVSVSYQGQPLRQFDDTQTPYRRVAADTLRLPAGWVASGLTTGMTALEPSLAPVRIESNRRTVRLSGKYFASRVWTLFGAYTHSEKTGTAAVGASFLTEALELPAPLDYRTDSFEAGALWTAGTASVRIVYSGSWFKDGIRELLFENPYSPLVPGSTEGLLARPPDNDLQQVSISGEIELPIWSGSLTYAASDGRLAQDGSFVPGSTLASNPVTLPGSLQGNIDLSHYALALAFTPVSGLSMRGRASYDGRDDHASALAVAYVVTDTYPGGTYVTPRYSEDHTRLDGSVDYRFFRWVRAGVGGTYTHTHYSPGQVLTSLDGLKAWGYGTINPLAVLSFTIKAGSSRRDASAFNPSALPRNENPLMYAYDYAPRDRQFETLRATWSATPALTWSLEGSTATDAYRLSELGLRDSRERELATTLAWSPEKPWSVYVDGSYEHLEASQNSLQTAGAPLWHASQGEYFWIVGAGGQWAVSSRWHLKVDYRHADSRTDTTLSPGGLTEGFPENRTGLDSLTVDSTYHWSRALSLHLRYTRGRYDTNDWALQNVYPDTVPTLLALGAQPYRYSVDVMSLSAIYRLGN